MRIKSRLVHKTASYTVNPAVDRTGTIFTNGGASGAVTFTLPTASRQLAGESYHFACLVDQNMTVAGPSAGSVVATNNAAAASVTLSTGNQKIGGRLQATCVETSLNSGTFKWLVTVVSAGHTGTVA